MGDVDLTLAYPFKGPDILEHTPEIIPDVDDIGKGHEWPTRQELERWDTKLKRSFDLTSFMAGWIGAFGLGAVNSALVSTSLAYEHTCKFSDPAVDNHQLPIATVVERLSSGIKRKVRDLVVSDFTIEGSGKNRLSLEMNLVGSGFKEVSTLTMPTLTAGKFLRMSGTTLQVGIAGSEVDVSSRLKKWTLKVSNNLFEEDGYYPGSGLYRGRCLYGKRKVDFNFALELEESDDVGLDHLESGQELKAILSTTGDLIEDTSYHQLILTIPKLKYSLVPIGIEDQKQVYSLECNVFYDSGISGPIELKVTNTQASYLA